MLNHENEGTEKARYNQKANDNKNEMGAYRHPLTFVKSEVIGKCPCCDENVNNDQLYVEEEEIIYHYSCYNIKRANKKNE